MGNIGDAFLGVNLETGQLYTQAKKAGDKAGQTLGQRMSVGVKKASSGLFAGLGIGAGISAFSALDTAISKTIGFLSDAVAAAREDQASLAGLGAALKANIPEWDGNTDAIEKTITARQRLGFTDDEQRKSMELLVGATHDVSKALDIQRVAMDLAVRRHVSLQVASEALVKVEGGQYRALKALGIILPKNATATEALAAAQKVVAGAAEAEARTDNGKLKAAQIALGERVEKLGYTLLPIVTDAMLAVAEAAGPVVDGLAGIVEAAKEADAFVKQYSLSANAAAEETDFLGSKTTPLGGLLHLLADEISGVAEAERNAHIGQSLDPGPVVDFAASMHVARGTVVTDFKDMAAGSTSAATKITDGLQKIIDSAERSRDRLTTLGQDTADAYWDPQILAGQLAATQRDIAEQRQIIASKDSTKAQVLDAKQRLLELNKTKFEQISALAAYGGEAAKSALATQIEMLKGVKHASADQIAELKKLEAAYRALAYAEADAKNKSLGHNTGGVGDRGRAKGGPVKAKTPYIVGENRRPELFVPESNGTIVPRVPAWMTMGAPSASYGAVPTSETATASGPTISAPITIHATSLPERMPHDIARQIRRKQRLAGLPVPLRQALTG